jgi:hypothetical protein
VTLIIVRGGEDQRTVRVAMRYCGSVGKRDERTTGVNRKR